ncbi:hypothetical protein ONS95_010099 [Cadophora gregata]|uniref:uncharacterized protein n=1 Tax=Cadophora gregata TaxID=51156 RepID=UPI0026DCCB9D|nr:uncharacterized protein ONS95_010099 [Cadophora gregata]KAK0121816.1 hypothetical protein ONS95_010099 [Cadophora gregata]KAK0127295.1 hypothetical protein ONS96_006845 [Cadophora gregata f. sp. sojae]
MFAKSILVASLAAMALADPIPAPAPQATTDLGSLPTDAGDLSSLLDAATSLAGTDLNSLLNDATSALGVLSDIPTLPASVQSVLATAVPESELTRTDIQCIATATPDWFKSLPNDAKSAISSYETALASWYSEHSSELGSLTTGVPQPCAAATGSGASPTTTGGSNATPASSSGSGSAAQTGTSTAAAPRATAMAASIAGLAGMLGVMVAL